MFDSRRGGSHLDGGIHIWYTAECEVCGKTYSFTPEYVYKGCCSWSCYNKKMNNEARRQREAKKEKEIGTVERRIQQCEAKIRYYSAILDKAQNERTKVSAKAQKQMWKKQLSIARTHREDMARLDMEVQEDV